MQNKLNSQKYYKNKLFRNVHGALSFQFQTKYSVEVKSLQSIYIYILKRYLIRFGGNDKIYTDFSNIKQKENHTKAKKQRYFDTISLTLCL